MIPDILKRKRGRPRKLVSDEDERAKPYEEPSRRGRPRRDTTYAGRMKHVRAVFLLMVAKYTADQVAKACKTNRSTIYRWKKLVEGYDDPEAVALMEMARDGKGIVDVMGPIGPIT